MKKIFIDGSAGTTGLRIRQRLSGREDIELINLPEEMRKDAGARREALNSAEVAFLCLPDDAAREAVSMTESENTVIIDTSTAHRTAQGWCYGFPELFSDGFERVAKAKRIAVPGCYASGFIALVYPLVESGLLPPDAPVTCHAVSGYSGAGKKAIEIYEGEGKELLMNAPRQYALTQQHKHLKEMKVISGLENEPIFCPYVDDYYCGMNVTVPLFASQLREGTTIEDIKAVYRNKYTGPVVQYAEDADVNGFISAMTLAGKDCMKVSVYGNETRILLTAVFDNLGKGASGAAVECLNIVLGKEPTFGLEL